MKRWFPAFLTMWLLLSAAPTAAAEDRAAARELYKEGTRQFDIGDYQAALSAFKKAYLNFEDPGLLFNIAQSYRQLGEKADALRFYKLYLTKLEKAPNRDFVERMINDLETAVAQDKEARSRAPTSTLPPEQPAPPTAAPAVTPAVQPVASDDRRTPVYKKWWLWTVVGVVVVGAAVGVGVGVAESGSSGFKTTLPAMGPAASRLQLHVEF